MDWIQEFLNSSRNLGKINSNTLEIYRKDLEDFDGFIIGKDLLNVKPEDILNFIEKLKKKYSDRSIYRKLSSIKGFYKYLCENRIIENSPATGIELSKKINNRTEPLEKWEITNILDICGDSYEERRDSVLIRLLCETGLKIGDILDLERDSLELSKYNTVIIYSNSRIINEPLSNKLAADLEEFVEEKFLQKYPDGNRIFGELSRQAFRVRFKIYGRRAGISRDISPSMIKKMVVEEKLKEEEGMTLIDKIRAEYMRIGIGDD